MNKIELIENKVICENPHSPFNYFAWPTVGRLPGGELLTAYYQYGEEVETCRIKQCVWEIPEEILK